MEVNGNRFAEDDEAVLVLQELFEARKEENGGDVVEEDDWGLDEMDEMELEWDPESEEEEEAEHEVEERAEKLIKEAEEAQEEPVALRADKDVDELAKQLGNTAI